MTRPSRDHPVEVACHRIAAGSPVDVAGSAVLSDALDSIETDLTAAEVATSIIATATVIGLCHALIAALVFQTMGLGVLAGVLGSTGVLVGGAYAVPFVVATRRRASWLGALPGFVCRTTLGMRLSPTLEAGLQAAFKATDPLTDRVPMVHGQPPGALLSAALADLDSDANRVQGLLEAAPTATDPDALLDRAIETVLAATRKHTREYVSSLQAPVTALYAFGVVLPLALVGILPAAPLAGYELPLVWLAVLFDGLLPMTLIAATGWLAARRPGVDPRPKIPAGHPTLGATWSVFGYGVLGIVSGIAISRALPAWSIWVVPVAWGTSGVLLARYSPAKSTVTAYDETRDGLPDLLAVLGDEMADGAPAEYALDRAADLPGIAGDIASEAAVVRNRLTVTVADALVGTHGPLTVLDDRHSDTISALVAAAETAGPPGGRALSRYATHLDDIHDLERMMRAELARTTGTLRQTATYYAPAIAGVTVALATRLGETASALSSTRAGFPLVIGGYVLILAVVLPVLSETVTDGWCRVRVGTAVGGALAIAGVVFPVVATATGRLL